MFNRPRTGVVLSVLAQGTLALVISACGSSKQSPSPTAPSTAGAPVALTVTSVSPTSGATVGLGEIRVLGTGFLPGATLTLGGVAARVRGVTATVIDAETPVHAAGSVDVVATNPGGESRTLAGGYAFVAGVFSLTASPSLVTSGGQLTVSWVAPSGRGCIGGGDWVAIFKVGDPDVTGAANGHSDLWFDHLCGATSGTSTLNAPTQPGQYEFRYMIGSTAVARSAPLTVGPAPKPSPAPARHSSLNPMHREDFRRSRWLADPVHAVEGGVKEVESARIHAEAGGVSEIESARGVWGSSSWASRNVRVYQYGFGGVGPRQSMPADEGPRPRQLRELQSATECYHGPPEADR